MLSLERVTSGYVEEIDILRDVSLEVKQGSITGIIGPNGAGKSTLLKTIFGFLRPRSGKIVFQGNEIQGRRPYELKQIGISYMLQEFSTFPQLTVEDNLLLGAWILRGDKRLLKKRLQEVYALFPVLAERRGEKATYLSGGSLRMLCIGKEIMNRPGLLLLDEPSAGLSPKFVKEVYGLIAKVAQWGTTILLVDQNILKAVEISTHMYLLEMGRVKQEGPKGVFEASIREIIRDSLISR
jgi:ABC-type branched-subunit amino acid transport system ATPase component